MAYRALLDTCVLYPPYLRDSLLRLATDGLYVPLLSEEILGELAANLPPQSRAPELIRTAFPEALVTGYQHLAPSMPAHPKDRHVMAAAVHGHANALITYNLRDFRQDGAAAYGLEVLGCDAFLLDLLDLAPGRVIDVLRTQASAHRRPPRELAGLLDRLAAGGAKEFADEVRSML